MRLIITLNFKIGFRLRKMVLPASPSVVDGSEVLPLRHPLMISMQMGNPVCCAPRYQVDEGRERAAERNANTESYCCHDRQDSSSSGRHHRVNHSSFQSSFLCSTPQLCRLDVLTPVFLLRDGTTSTVLLIGELMKQAERYLNEGCHPRVIAEVLSPS